MKNSVKLFGLLILSLYCIGTNASNKGPSSIDQSRVITLVKKAESYIKKNGIQRSIIALVLGITIHLTNREFVQPRSKWRLVANSLPEGLIKGTADDTIR
jgi:hypothetical protein